MGDRVTGWGCVREADSGIWFRSAAGGPAGLGAAADTVPVRRAAGGACVTIRDCGTDHRWEGIGRIHLR